MISNKRLPTTPKAFQNYVLKFFKKVKFQGKNYWAAFLTIQSPKSSVIKGIAPSHNVDLIEFKEDLPKGKNLNDWMMQAIKQKIIFSFSQSWDDGCLEELSD